MLASVERSRTIAERNVARSYAANATPAISSAMPLTSMFIHVRRREIDPYGCAISIPPLLRERPTVRLRHCYTGPPPVRTALATRSSSELIMSPASRAD